MSIVSGLRKRVINSPKVLFITPPLKRWDVVSAQQPYPGYAFLGAILEQNNITVEVLDCNLLELSLHEMLALIEQKSPDIVGIGVYPSGARSVMKAMRMIKNVSKDIVTVLGGPQVTALPALYAKDPDIDFVVIGEGDYTFTELVQEISKENSNFSSIAGIAFNDRDGYVQTLPRPLVQNLDELPAPAYHLLPMDILSKEKDPAYKKHFLSIVTSRGCTHHCFFCPQWKPYNGVYRSRSPHLVVDELEMLHHKYNIELVEFTENLMNASRKRIKEFVRIMIERKVPVKWGFLPRSDTIIRDRDIVPQMVKAGLVYALVGIESFSKGKLEEINKGQTIHQAKEGIHILNDNGVATIGSYIVGWTDDTKETIKAIPAFLEEVDADLTFLPMLSPYPGSLLWDKAYKEGMIMDFNFSHYDEKHPVMKYTNISPFELVDLGNWLYAQQFSKKQLMRNLFLRDTIWSDMVAGFMEKSDIAKDTFLYSQEEIIDNLEQGALCVDDVPEDEKFLWRNHE